MLDLAHLGDAQKKPGPTYPRVRDDRKSCAVARRGRAEQPQEPIKHGHRSPSVYGPSTLTHRGTERLFIEADP
jgi:hypothetical protein